MFFGCIWVNFYSVVCELNEIYEVDFLYKIIVKFRWRLFKICIYKFWWGCLFKKRLLIKLKFMNIYFWKWIVEICKFIGIVGLFCIIIKIISM